MLKTILITLSIIFSVIMLLFIYCALVLASRADNKQIKNNLGDTYE